MAMRIPLYPYQDEAVDKFLERGDLLLAYEMGLGKTILGLAAVEELLANGEAECAFVVCAASLKYQWAEAIAMATDVPRRTIRVKSEGQWQEIQVPTEDACILIDGTPAKRAEQYRKVRETRPDYVLLSYENVVNDWRDVSRIKPEVIILDEATAIKSFKAKRTKKVKRLTAPYRLALTGTPIDNKPEEVFSIMQWVNPEVLGRFDLFDNTYIRRNHFGGVEGYKNLPTLHDRLSGAMSRKTRMDPDVAPYMPDVAEDDWHAAMDPKTRAVYRVIAKELLEELESLPPGGMAFDLQSYYSGDADHDDKSAQGRVMARHLALEMLLAHPELIRRSAAAYEAGLGHGSRYALDLVEAGLIDDLTSTPKLDYLAEEIEVMLETHPKNKVIVFSFFRDMSELIAEAVPQYGSVRFHGQMDAGAKAGAKVKFTTDPNCRLFLSSHAGSMGVDLFMANHLVNYDLTWSSGKQDQINARHVRASSLFDKVFIHNLLVTGSIEQWKKDKASLKRRVARAVVDGKGADRSGNIDNDVDSLTNFLRATL